jgi:putative phosphoribosyl transferase
VLLRTGECLLVLNLASTHTLKRTRLNLGINVIERPQDELPGRYFEADLIPRFDIVIYIDHTSVGATRYDTTTSCGRACRDMSLPDKFRDRSEAGRLLGERLDWLSSEQPIVFGLARGGVPVAFEVARVLACPLDVLVVRKLGVPSQLELAFGAIGEPDTQVLNTALVARLGLSKEEIATILKRERAELTRRIALYRGDRALLEMEGRTVVIVDDGLATGATARVAVEVIRARGAKKIIVAVPVAPHEAISELRALADEVVCLHVPVEFRAVGEWYEDFSQTSDVEVTTLLDESSH